MNPGNLGAPEQDVRIRLIKMKQFRVRKRRFFMIAIEFFIIPIHYTRVKIKKDTDVAVSLPVLLSDLLYDRIQLLLKGVDRLCAFD